MCQLKLHGTNSMVHNICINRICIHLHVHVCVWTADCITAMTFIYSDKNELHHTVTSSDISQNRPLFSIQCPSLSHSLCPSLTYLLVICHIESKCCQPAFVATVYCMQCYPLF